MTPDVNSLDIHELPKILQQLGLAGNMKVAVVYAENSHQKEDLDFYQIGAWSMGINNLHHFTNMQQAMNWLLA